jgi:hypothetical protein
MAIFLFGKDKTVLFCHKNIFFGSGQCNKDQDFSLLYSAQSDTKVNRTSYQTVQTDVSPEPMQQSCKVIQSTPTNAEDNNG